MPWVLRQKPTGLKPLKPLEPLKPLAPLEPLEPLRPLKPAGGPTRRAAAKRESETRAVTAEGDSLR
jgi:hypothetical protein